MKLQVYGKGTVDLSLSDFVAKGGQASVYSKAGLAYKVYTNPADMIPDGKFHELRKIKDKRVIRPLDVLLTVQGERVGFTMDLVLKSAALGQLFNRSFRDRNQINDRAMLSVAASLQDRVRSVHQAGLLVVDLNELNCLYDFAYREATLIDVDSFQCPGYPATVIMPSVRDYSVKASGFTENSDWYSYAILMFNLFVGAHPYRGGHPKTDALPPEKRLEFRMKGNLSAFHKDARLPGCCPPVSSIPNPLHDWLRAVLEDGKRLPPPDPFGQALPVVAAAKAPVRPPDALVEWAKFNGSISQFCSCGTLSLAVSSLPGRRIEIETRFDNRKEHVFCLDNVTDSEVVAAFVGAQAAPMALLLESKGAAVISIATGYREQVASFVKGITRSGNRLLFQVGDGIFEVVDVKAIGRPSYVMVANVMENSTTLFEGVAIQSMLGSIHCCVLPETGGAIHVKTPELDGLKVLDAKRDRQIMLVTVANKLGGYELFTFKFSKNFEGYEFTRQPTSTSDVNFCCTDRGSYAVMFEDKIVVRPVALGSGDKHLEINISGHGYRLARAGGRAGIVINDTIMHIGKD